MGRILMRLARAGVGAVVLGTMFGCAGSLQPKTFETGTSLQKELRVRTHDLSGKPISEGTVRDALAAALIAGGRTPTSYGERHKGSYQGSDTYLTHGVRSKATASGIEVEYLNGTKVTSSTAAPSYYESRIAATFPLEVRRSEDGELYRAVLGFPAQVTMTPPPFMPFAKPAYLMTDGQVIPHLRSKYDALNKVTIAAMAEVTGEVTVDAAPDAVRGNLERILGKYSGKENAYDLDVQGHKHPLLVKLYPYKSGCKMKYYIEIPYSVSETTSLTDADIEAIKRRIESMAKD